MTRARKHLVCIHQTTYYLITARCVRRAFLCGTDRVSGQCYEHRRGWIEDRLRALSSLFNLELCAYAIMSNHYHLVVRLNAEDASQWSMDQVLNRWTSLFRGSLLAQRYLAGEPLSAAQTQTVNDTVSVYRDRLASLSWFMKCLNEPIARRANAEDQCTGHFWEARFHSKALLSEPSLIQAMTYVDLNPVRAKIADTLKDSEYTSIRCRLSLTADVVKNGIDRLLADGDLYHFSVPVRTLSTFSTGVLSGNEDSVLPIQQSDYVDLVEAIGRARVAGKRGVIGDNAQRVANRFGIDTEQALKQIA